jgi:hypothetical protein
LVHDRDREKPVYFTWEILDLNLPEAVRDRMGLNYEGREAPARTTEYIKQEATGLVQVPGPTGAPARPSVATGSYTKRIIRDYTEQDARNRNLGLAVEEAVLTHECEALVAGGRPDLAALVFHVANAAGAEKQSIERRRNLELRETAPATTSSPTLSTKSFPDFVSKSK